MNIDIKHFLQTRIHKMPAGKIFGREIRSNEKIDGHQFPRSAFNKSAYSACISVTLLKDGLRRTDV